MFKYLLRPSLIIFLYCYGSLAFSSPQLTKDHFLKNDVIHFKYFDREYYGIIASYPIYKFPTIETEYINSQLELKAKGKLSSYLNQKYKKNSTYILNSFTNSTSCNTKENFCRIYFIDRNNIKKVESESNSGNHHPNENTEHNLQQNIENTLISIALENNDNITIVELDNLYFLVSSAQVDLNGLSARERLTEIKKIDILTEKNLSTFINSPSVEVEELLISKTTSTQAGHIITEKYIEKIRESSKGIISKATKLGKIIQNHYISIIYIEIPLP